MPRTKTKLTKKPTSKPKKAAAAKRTKAPAPEKPRVTGLRPTHAGGRALLAMIRLYLDDDWDGDDRRQARKELLVHGFLHRNEYGLDWSSLDQLERDIRQVLLADGTPHDLGAIEEAQKLAAALVEKVFELKHQKLKELVPKAIAAVAQEGKAVRDAEQKARAARSRQASRSPRASSTARSKTKAKSSPATTSAKKAGKRRPSLAKKAEPPTTGAKSKAGKRGLDEGSVELRAKARDLAGLGPVPQVRPAAAEGRGADDPRYAEALDHLRSLGNHVADNYAIEEITGELDISLYRAEAILEAVKASGDWPQREPSSSPPDAQATARGQATDTAKAGSNGAAKANGDPHFPAALRFVAEQERLGKKPTPSALKKALGVGHSRAAFLLERVKGATALPS